MLGAFHTYSEKKAAPKVRANQAAAAIDLCSRTRIGTVALSFFHRCMPTKTKSVKPKRTHSAMMRPSDHAYVDPPHCNARSRQIIMGKNTAKPSRSNCLTLAFHPDCSFCAR